jgi:glycerol-3-phosphate dehydrogenase
LGTTDTAFHDAPDNVGVSTADISGFLDFINANLPSAHLKPSDVQHFYAGLRPLVDDGSGDTYGASRKAELIDHSGSDGLKGLFSAIGGKWTTSRELAEKTVDALVEKLGMRGRNCTTEMALTPSGGIGRFKLFEAQMKAEHDPVPNITHLARLYGTRVRDVLAIGQTRPELRVALSESGDIGAQVLFAIREEMAMTLEDVVMRRTGIGQLGDPGAAKIARTADLMASELGWTDARKAKEIQSIAANFALRPQ